MRRLPRGPLCAVAAAGVASVLPAVAAAQGEENPVTRGEYLANLGGCSHCHTAEAGDYAGGVVLDTPFGQLVGPNITSDPETGIGDWSRDDFEAALRQGRSKDGSPLYPAMPYDSYTKLTDADIDALWAYFRQVDPIENEVEVIELPFPFNVRQGVDVWQALYFEAGRFEPDMSKSDEINRGAYLAEGLAHCTSCHTPRNALGGPVTDQPYQGALVDGWYAPNISGSAGSALEKFDHDTLTAYLANRNPDGLAAFGAMYQVTASLEQAREEDVSAISAYILDRASEDEIGRSPEVADIPDDVIDAGEAVYAGQCVACHGSDGMGGEAAARLVDNGGVTAQSPVNVVNVLLAGVEARNDWGAMPSFAEVLTDQEISDVANYVRRTWGNAGPEAATPELVAQRRPEAEINEDLALIANCPAPGDADIPVGLAGRISDLTNRAVTPDDLGPIVSDFSSVRSEIGYSDALSALTANYCQALADTEPQVNRAVFLERQLAFMNSLDDALRDSGKSPEGE